MGHTFQLFHSFDIKLCANILIKSPEMKKEHRQNGRGIPIFTLFFLNHLFNHYALKLCDSYMVSLVRIRDNLNYKTNGLQSFLEKNIK